MSSALPQKHQLNSLTGLRFLAAFAVFIAHVAVHWPDYEFGTVPWGAAGVSFFFVLSGFILTYVYGPPATNDTSTSSGIELTFSVRQFYIKRVARIWPLHLVTLLISLFLVIGISTFFNRPFPVGKLMTNGLLLQSWIPSYPWIYSLNGPSWSLSVEAFFYALFPFLVWGGAKRFFGIYILIVIATFLGLLCVDHLVPTDGKHWVKLNAIVHVNPLMRLFEFATGVGAGFLFLQRGNGKPAVSFRSSTRRDTVLELLMAGFVISFFMVSDAAGMYGIVNQTALPDGFWYWFRFCGAAPVFACLILAFAQTRGPLTRILGSRILVYLGEISYSFYMIHMAVMLVMARYPWNESAYLGIGSVICCFVFSVFLASGLYHLVELPFRRLIVGRSIHRDGKSLVSPFVRGLKEWFRTPWFAPLLALVLGAGWFVVVNRFDVHDPGRISEIVSATDPAVRGARFENDAILQGVVANRGADGGMNLQVVWELRPGRRATRFIKLLDRDHQVIGRGPSNSEQIEDAEPGVAFIDRVRMSSETMEGVVTIAIGFFDQNRKSAVVDRGPRSAGNRQLHVWSIKESRDASQVPADVD